MKTMIKISLLVSIALGSFIATQEIQLLYGCYSTISQWKSLREYPFYSTIECRRIYKQFDKMPCKEGICQ